MDSGRDKKKRRDASTVRVGLLRASTRRQKTKALKDYAEFISYWAKAIRSQKLATSLVARGLHLRRPFGASASSATHPRRQR